MEEEIKTNEEIVTTETEEIKEEQPETKEEQPKKNSIKDDLLKERRKRQELEKRVKEYESKLYESEYQSEKMQLKQSFVDDGFDEVVAEKLAAREAKTTNEIKKLSEIVSNIYNPVKDEIKELAKSDEFFSDAMAYEQDIAAKMKQLNCGAEEAYIVLRGRERTREIRENLEVRAQYEKSEKEEKALPQSAAGKSKELYPLTDDEKASLKLLQRLKPKEGWTVEKYWKNKNR